MRQLLPRPRLRRPQRWLTSWRVLCGVAIVGLVIGGFGVHSLQQQIEARAVRSANFSARLVATMVVGESLRLSSVIGGPLGVRDPAAVDIHFKILESDGVLTGLAVWSVLDGRLLYADPVNSGNVAIMPPGAIDRGRRGEVFSLAKPDADGDSATRYFFVPLDIDGDGDYDALVEVLIPDDPINSEIAQSTHELYGGAAAAAVLGCLALWGVRRRQRKDQHAAGHDALTGLGNRVFLAERVEHALTAPADNGRVALLLLDLERFKEVNDTLGHHAGDELLVAVAARLRDACRDCDTVARLGGDEFAVLLAGFPAADSAITMANRLLDQLRQPVTVEGLVVDVDASIGVALAPQHGQDLPTLLRCADVAMYEAKRASAGVAVYDVATDPREAQQLNLLGELRRALNSDELRLYYQPKSTAGGQITQVEALLRWQHPERGLLGPAHFVPLAERTSLVKPMTAWVLEEAARQAAAWRTQGYDLQIAVNVSPRNLLDDDLPALVLQAATAAGIPVSLLQIEITETAVMADPVRATDVLTRLRSMGVHVAVDDFGVGYTSLSYLTTLPVQTIKIDRRFVADLLENNVDEAVVRNVIHLAHDLGMTTVAEGVESREVWQRLNQLGCEEIQGYVLTKPLPSDDLLDWIAAWRRTHTAAPYPGEEPSAVGAVSL
jgi:diguanylate cyclase (GGDEF)-like protein